MTPKALLHGAKGAKEEDHKSFLCGPFGFAQGRLGVPSAEFILTKEGLRTGLARKSSLKRSVEHFIGKNLSHVTGADSLAGQ